MGRARNPRDGAARACMGCGGGQAGACVTQPLAHLLARSGAAVQAGAPCAGDARSPTIALFDLCTVWCHEHQLDQGCGLHGGRLGAPALMFAHAPQVTGKPLEHVEVLAARSCQCAGRALTIRVPRKGRR